MRPRGAPAPAPVVEPPVRAFLGAAMVSSSFDGLVVEVFGYPVRLTPPLGSRIPRAAPPSLNAPFQPTSQDRQRSLEGVGAGAGRMLHPEDRSPRRSQRERTADRHPARGSIVTEDRAPARAGGHAPPRHQPVELLLDLRAQPISNANSADPREHVSTGSPGPSSSPAPPCAPRPPRPCATPALRCAPRRAPRTAGSPSAPWPSASAA